jgi:NhaP-type Na+/H+ or K+/H+ antiporter
MKRKIVGFGLLGVAFVLFNLGILWLCYHDIGRAEVGVQSLLLVYATLGGATLILACAVMGALTLQGLEPRRFKKWLDK